MEKANNSLPQSRVRIVLPVIFLLGIIGVVLSPFFISQRKDILSVLSMALLFGSLACAWNLHALSGLISLGHSAFFGIGAYAAVLSSYYFGINPWYSLFIGGLAAAIYSAIWFGTFFRLRHGAYTLATFAAAEIAKVIVDNWDSLTMGSSGISNIPCLINTEYQEKELILYYLISLVLFIIVFTIHWLAINSTWGFALRTIRENEITAESIGVPENHVKFVTLLMSSFITGICGVLYVHRIGYVEPTMVFNLHISAIPIVFAYLGGRYFSLGPLVGGLVLYCLDQFVVLPLFPKAHLAIYGLVIVLVIRFLPEGILSCFTHQKKNAWN